MVTFNQLVSQQSLSQVVQGRVLAEVSLGRVSSPPLVACSPLSGGTGTPVTITANLSGLAPGQYGWHVHTYGDATSGGEDTGGVIDLAGVVGPHFSIGDRPHGCFPDTNRHHGDLGTAHTNATRSALCTNRSLHAR